MPAVIYTIMAKYDIAKIQCLDFILLSGNTFAQNITGTAPTGYLPLISADFYYKTYHERLSDVIRAKDSQQLLMLKQTYSWKFDVDYVHKLKYDTIVVTDASKKIIWANDGFKTMTGYTVKHAIGKTAAFLQGAATSQESRNSIKEGLATGRAFTTNLINYRKNGGQYACEVTIHPLYNTKNILTHFIAFEREAA